MVTRFGYKILAWLVDRGWVQVQKDHYEDQYGDPLLFDDITKEEVTPHKALDLHFQRTGEHPDFMEDE